MIVEVKPERAYELIEKIATWIVERRLAPAAILTLESIHPLRFISSQATYAISPFIGALFDNESSVQEFAAMIENREYYERLIKRIDELDEEMHRKARERKKLLKKNKPKRFKNFIKRLFKK